MIDKSWYDAKNYNLVGACQHLQEFIDFYCKGTEFKKIEDIKTETLGDFLKIIFKYYQLYLFSSYELRGLAESITYLFFAMYEKEFPEYSYPKYADDDQRTLYLDLLGIMDTPDFLLQEDLPVIFEYMDSEGKDIALALKKLKNYLEQFDYCERCNIEIPKRIAAINQERIDAIKNSQPLPIRPISIKLSMCYKHKKI